MKKHSLLFSLTLAALLPMAAVAQNSANKASANKSSSASATTGRSSSWDLKGIRLGMSKADALAAVPQFTCHASAPGVESCRAKGVTFAGGSAEMGLNLLDDKVINVEAVNLGFDQLIAANDALTAKYGYPDVDNEIRMPHDFKYYNNLAWKDGTAHLFTFPDRSDRSKTPVSVTLRETSLVGDWIARDKAGSVSQSVASDI